MSCGTVETTVPQITLNAVQGDSFSKTFLWRDKETQVPIDLTGYSARMQVRKRLTSSSYFVEITDGAGITLGDADGTILIEMLPTQTNLIDVGNNVYDLELTDTGGVVTTLFGGTFALAADTTR